MAKLRCVGLHAVFDIEWVIINLGVTTPTPRTTRKGNAPFHAILRPNIVGIYVHEICCDLTGRKLTLHMIVRCGLSVFYQVPPLTELLHGQQLNYVLTEDGQSYGRMRSFDLKAQISQMNSRQEMSESLRIPSCLAISCTTVRSNELRMLEIQMEVGEALAQPDSGTDG